LTKKKSFKTLASVRRWQKPRPRTTNSETTW